MEAIAKVVESLMGASGINEYQAKLATYYAISTHLDLDMLALLVILGKHGTGKSWFMKQLKPYLCEAVWVNAKTYASLREGLNHTKTALIEEGDKADEELLICRYSKQTSEILIRAGGSGRWANQIINVFGATVLHKRRPFADPALRSRAIILKTKRNPGKYRIRNVGNEEVKAIADIAKSIDISSLPTSERVSDTWRGVILACNKVGDVNWLNYAKEQIESDKKALDAGQGYEPEELFLSILQDKMLTELGMAMDVKIRDVKHALHEYEIDMHMYQIDEMARAMGFTVTRPSGYPVIKADGELLNRLLKGI